MNRDSVKPPENPPYTHAVLLPTGIFECEISSDGDAIYTNEKIFRSSKPVRSVPGEYPKVRIVFYVTPIITLLNRFDNVSFKKLPIK